MYAIIRTGGHQEKVAPGEQIIVDRLKQAEGERITFAPLMISKGDGSVVSDRKELEAGEATVVGTVLQHLKGDKVDIFQYRNKTGYRRHTGHRQPLTLVEIAEIRLGGEVATAPEKPAEEPAPAEETAAEKPAKKPAAKKPAAKAKGGKADGAKSAAEKGASKAGSAKASGGKKPAAKKKAGEAE
jgi:large subunit ribosomal protein L21